MTPSRSTTRPASAPDVSMRAAVNRRFGGPDVVAIERVAKPVPRRNEVLIQVVASTVSVADYRVRTRDVPKGLRLMTAFALGVFAPRHRILGMDVAGIVESVGADVTDFRPGDRVIGALGSTFGGHAEYVCLPQDGPISLAPSNLALEDAVALVFGGLTARSYLNRVAIGPGTRVLVNGASGAVGTATVQLAKHLGAHVTGVTSAGNGQLVTSLGADRVIDYTAVDFAAGDETYDVIVDCVGNAAFDRVAPSINPGGALLLVILDLKSMILAASQSRKSGKVVAASAEKWSAANLRYLVQLAEAGVLRPVVDRSYDLDDIVEAHRYVATGRKKGSVVVRVARAK